MTQLDYDLDRYYESIEEQGECKECGTTIDLDKHYCSRDCFNASML